MSSLVSQSSKSRGGDIAGQIQQLNGSHEYLGTIQSTGTNVISNVNGTLEKGGRYLVQADAPGYLSPSNHATVPFSPNTLQTAATGLKLAADQKYMICLSKDSSYGSADGQAFLQWISLSGTTNLKVFRMR